MENETQEQSEGDTDGGLPWWSSGQNLPCNAGDMGSIPGHKTKIPYSMEHLSMHKAKTEPVRKDLA